MAYSGNTDRQRQDLPPMLRSYLEYKERFKDELLLFQVGDFYELFFDDAVKASELLDLTLTTRDKNKENPIPMCGVPINVVEPYVAKLTDMGYSVALVKQKDAPKGCKSVERELDRVITPGVRVLLDDIDSGKESILLAVGIDGLNLALAEVNSDTGKIRVYEHLSRGEILDEIKRISPSEILICALANASGHQTIPVAKEIEVYCGKRKPIKKTTISSYKGAHQNDEAYKNLSKTSKIAITGAIDYLTDLACGRSWSDFEIDIAERDRHLILSADTIAHLELVENNRDRGYNGTLLSLLDHCGSSMGRTTLRTWIKAPLAVKEEIAKRQESITFLIKHYTVLRNIMSEFKKVGALDKIATRIGLSAVTPRELGIARDTLSAMWRIKKLFVSLEEKEPLPTLIAQCLEPLSKTGEAFALLKDRLSENLPASLKDGGIFRDGLSQELDNLRYLTKAGRQWILQLEREERDKTGIQSLKVKYNNVFGYFIEVTKPNLSKVPAHYIRKQTMVNAERFITEDLKAKEAELLTAGERAIEIELSMYKEFVDELKKSVSILREVSESFGALDALASLAHVAQANEWCLPVVCEGKKLYIKNGRHPVIADILGERFIPNTLSLDTGREVALITGANMGGKSTYLRQNALLVILAQMGSYVPAEEMIFSIADQIFTRIGASDDLLEGESTFMMEMKESAFIARNATDQSIVLIDELGRGTATRDGIALAQAMFEWLACKVKCRSIFATHFYELVGVAERIDNAFNISVGSKETEEGIVFTHHIKNGPADRSYGLEVARMAGLPKSILQRARNIFNSRRNERDDGNYSLPLFEQVDETDYKQLYKDLTDEIMSLDINNATPLTTMQFLHAVQNKIKTRAK